MDAHGPTEKRGKDPKCSIHRMQCPIEADSRRFVSFAQRILLGSSLDPTPIARSRWRVNKSRRLAKGRNSESSPNRFTDEPQDPKTELDPHAL
jgi:hypothetical protein